MLGDSAFNLEEIERDSYKGSEVWSITLSFPKDLSSLSPVSRLATNPLEYKRILIDGETGDLLAIRLREVATR